MTANDTGQIWRQSHLRYSGSDVLQESFFNIALAEYSFILSWRGTVASLLVFG